MDSQFHFTKMQGAGNDYLYFNCLEKELPDPEKIAVALSPRHHAVGADGIVLICRSGVADAKMRMFNADGSEGKMCGNAIRCVARYLVERVGGFPDTLSIETLAGIRRVTVNRDEGGAFVSATVEMGRAKLDGRSIPVDADGLIRDYPLPVGNRNWAITAVSMGNPHAVTFVKNTRRMNLEKIGPLFENHPFFPDRVNTEFVRVIDATEIEMRVWERGSGETLACGTGACAAVVAACINGKCPFDLPVTVRLPGGCLSVECRSDLTLTLTGDAAFVFDGVCPA